MPKKMPKKISGAKIFIKIDKLCKQNKITFYRLAKECGISRSCITKWKNDEMIPSLESINAVALYFDVPIETLI